MIDVSSRGKSTIQNINHRAGVASYKKEILLIMKTGA